MELRISRAGVNDDNVGRTATARGSTGSCGDDVCHNVHEFSGCAASVRPPVTTPTPQQQTLLSGSAAPWAHQHKRQRQRFCASCDGWIQDKWIPAQCKRLQPLPGDLQTDCVPQFGQKAPGSTWLPHCSQKHRDAFCGICGSGAGAGGGGTCT